MTGTRNQFERRVPEAAGESTVTRRIDVVLTTHDPHRSRPRTEELGAVGPPVECPDPRCDEIRADLRHRAPRSVDDLGRRVRPEQRPPVPLPRDSKPLVSKASQRVIASRRVIVSEDGVVGSLLVVSGPPGVGKSSVARLLADRRSRSVLVEGDAFFGFLRAGAIEPWLDESHEQNTIVTRVAAQAAGEFTRHGYDTVYDGVVGPWFIDTFQTATGLDHVDYAVLLPPVDVCVQRVARRTGHDFTDESAARHMHAEFARHPVPDRHLFTDPHAPGVEIAEQIESARERGGLRLT